ncbi:MAG: type II secretion system minor pseudopilin GspK [Thermodesulfobacteriota bacterium]
MREGFKAIPPSRDGMPRPLARGSSQQGFVIVVVLLITAVLVAIVVEFAYNVYLSTARAGNFRDSQRAGLLAARSMEFAGAAVEELLKARPNLTIERDGLVFFDTEGDMTITIKVVDEMGKVSLRTVYEKTGEKNAAVYDEYSRLLKGLDIDGRQGLEGALADWIDADDEPRIYGAEAADYGDARPGPYSPGNSYIKCVDDLLMLKGYTPEVFGKVSPFVSAYNTGGLVNVNTAPKEVLMALSDEMTEALALEIIEFRAETPFKDRSDIMKVPGFETIGFDLQDKITVASDVFRIYSKVTSGDIARQAEAVYRINHGFVYWRDM